MSDLYYQVLIQSGGVFYDLSQDLNGFTIDEEGGKPDQLTIELKDPHKVFSHALKKGMGVEVDLGWVKDHSLMFRGHIYQVQGDFGKQQTPALKVIAYDDSIKMGLQKRNRIMVGSLSKIVKDIVGEHPAYFNPGSTSVEVGTKEANNKEEPQFEQGIRQQNETNLAFLRRLAKQYACELYVVPGMIKSAFHFEAQAYILAREPEAVVVYGRCGAKTRLLEFKPVSDVANMQPPQKYAGVDFNEGKPVLETREKDDRGLPVKDENYQENINVYKKENPLKGLQLEALINSAKEDDPLQENLRKELGGVVPSVTPCFTTADNLRIRAGNRAWTSYHGMRGNGTTVGDHRIHAQATLQVQDVGGEFSGAWYISKVKHVLNGQGYQTEFECQR